MLSRCTRTMGKVAHATNMLSVKQQALPSYRVVYLSIVESQLAIHPCFNDGGFKGFSFEG